MKILCIVLLPVAALVLAGCGAGQEPVKQYQFRGQVVSIDLPGHNATIKGEKIEGWMDAMTMEYPVKDDAELRALRPQEQITATVYVQESKYWLAGIHEAAAPQ